MHVPPLGTKKRCIASISNKTLVTLAVTTTKQQQKHQHIPNMQGLGKISKTSEACMTSKHD